MPVTFHPNGHRVPVLFVGFNIQFSGNGRRFSKSAVFPRQNTTTRGYNVVAVCV